MSFQIFSFLRKSRIQVLAPTSISSVQSLTCDRLFDPMDCITPGLPVHHQLLEFTQTYVHWAGDAIQPSHPLSSPSPPALNLSQHQGLFLGQQAFLSNAWLYLDCHSAILWLQLVEEAADDRWEALMPLPLLWPWVWTLNLGDKGLDLISRAWVDHWRLNMLCGSDWQFLDQREDSGPAVENRDVTGEKEKASSRLSVKQIEIKLKSEKVLVWSITWCSRKGQWDQMCPEASSVFSETITEWLLFNSITEWHSMHAATCEFKGEAIQSKVSLIS